MRVSRRTPPRDPSASPRADSTEVPMRLPITVLVLLFRGTTAGIEFAVFQRADDGNWQLVSGGVQGPSE